MRCDNDAMGPKATRTAWTCITSRGCHSSRAPTRPRGRSSLGSACWCTTRTTTSRRTRTSTEGARRSRCGATQSGAGRRERSECECECRGPCNERASPNEDLLRPHHPVLCEIACAECGALRSCEQARKSRVRRLGHAGIRQRGHPIEVRGAARSDPLALDVLEHAGGCVQPEARVDVVVLLSALPHDAWSVMSRVSRRAGRWARAQAWLRCSPQSGVVRARGEGCDDRFAGSRPRELVHLASERLLRLARHVDRGIGGTSVAKPRIDATPAAHARLSAAPNSRAQDGRWRAGHLIASSPLTPV